MTWLNETFTRVGAQATRLESAHWPASMRYGLAIAYVCLATWGRLVLPLDSAPYLLYMPGMFVIGFLLGLGPGITATIVSACAALTLVAIHSERQLFSTGEITGLILYLAISIALVINCDYLRGIMARRRDDLAAMQAVNDALMESRAALEASEAFLRSTLESSPDCIKVLDMQARVRFMNEPGKMAMEIPDFGVIEGCPWPDFWQDEGQVAAKAALVQAQAGKVARFEGFCKTMAGTPKWWDVVVAPILGPDGLPERLLAISRDITEQKRVEAQQRLLNHELGHRLKNMLAMVQAIANQTIKHAGSLAEARSAFESRLIALGKAQDVLTGTQWESAELDTIVRYALAPHAAEAARLTIAGPGLILSSRCSLALSLALHELATNAVKYGALSNDTGRIEVAWDIRDNDGAPSLEFCWTESGGPAVTIPVRTGFGSVMIERTLAGYFKGSAGIDYAPTGVCFRLKAPLTRSESEFTAGNFEILTVNELRALQSVD